MGQGWGVFPGKSCVVVGGKLSLHYTLVVSILQALFQDMLLIFGSVLYIRCWSTESSYGSSGSKLVSFSLWCQTWELNPSDCPRASHGKSNSGSFGPDDLTEIVAIKHFSFDLCKESVSLCNCGCGCWWCSTLADILGKVVLLVSSIPSSNRRS